MASLYPFSVAAAVPPQLYCSSITVSVSSRLWTIFLLTAWSLGLRLVRRVMEDAKTAKRKAVAQSEACKQRKAQEGWAATSTSALTTVRDRVATADASSKEVDAGCWVAVAPPTSRRMAWIACKIGSGMGMGSIVPGAGLAVYPVPACL
eukprot:contig_16429_g3992